MMPWPAVYSALDSLCHRGDQFKREGTENPRLMLSTECGQSAHIYKMKQEINREEVTKVTVGVGWRVSYYGAAETCMLATLLTMVS